MIVLIFFVILTYLMIGFFYWLALPSWARGTAVGMVRRGQADAGERVDSRLALHIDLLAHHLLWWPTFLFPEKE